MKRIAVLFLVLCMVSSLGALEMRDILLAAPQAAKTGLGLALVGGTLAEIGKQDLAGIGVGLALGTALALPSGMTLIGAIRKDGAAVASWRKVAMIADATLAFGALGYGIYSLTLPSNDPEGWDKLIGAFFVAVSIPLGAGAAVDAFPYSFEAEGR